MSPWCPHKWRGGLGTPLPPFCSRSAPCITHLLLVELTTDMGWFESSFTTRMLFCRQRRKKGVKGQPESLCLPCQPWGTTAWWPHCSSHLAAELQTLSTPGSCGSSHSLCVHPLTLYLRSMEEWFMIRSGSAPSRGTTTIPNSPTITSI